MQRVVQQELMSGSVRAAQQRGWTEKDWQEPLAGRSWRRKFEWERPVLAEAWRGVLIVVMCLWLGVPGLLE